VKKAMSDNEQGAMHWAVVTELSPKQAEV